MPDRPYSQVVGASGTAVITIESGAQRWSVTQISTELLNAPAGATCTVRKNNSIVTSMWPAGDVAGGDPPVDLWSSDELTITWTGCTPGAIAKATVFWTVIG